MTRTKRMSPSIIGTGAALVMLLLSGCAGLGGDRGQGLPSPDASAFLVDAKGADRGRADFFREAGGLRVELVARGFAPGTYGMHVHALGACSPQDFSGAGPHWNPQNTQHGRENPMGAHRGDLPNLVVETDQIGRATVMIEGAALKGEGALLDADGASFIIHAGPDDMKSDPSGNSGARIACGIVQEKPGK